MPRAKKSASPSLDLEFEGKEEDEGEGAPPSLPPSLLPSPSVEVTNSKIQEQSHTFQELTTKVVGVESQMENMKFVLSKLELELSGLRDEINFIKAERATVQASNIMLPPPDMVPKSRHRA